MHRYHHHPHRPDYDGLGKMGRRRWGETYVLRLLVSAAALPLTLPFASTARMISSLESSSSLFSRAGAFFFGGGGGELDTFPIRKNTPWREDLLSLFSTEAEVTQQRLEIGLFESSSD